MTIIANPVTGPLVGAPIQPGFGVQNAGSAPANTAIAVPAGMTSLEAQSRGILPANALVTSINGINVGLGDAATVAELHSNGNGVAAMRGTAPAPSGGINDQAFVGNQTAIAMSANGPTPVNTEAQPLGPVSSAILGSNVSLTAGGFGG